MSLLDTSIDLPKDGYIYLLKEKKYIDEGVPVYKIGRTQNMNQRKKNGYKAGLQLYNLIYCVNIIKCEDELKKIYTEKYKLIEGTRESFYCENFKEMKYILFEKVEEINELDGFYDKMNLCKVESITDCYKGYLDKLPEIKQSDTKVIIEEKCKNILHRAKEYKTIVVDLDDLRKKNIKECPRCNKKFEHFSRLKKHVLGTRNCIKKEYICVTCNKSFKKKYNLMRHVNGMNQTIMKKLEKAKK